jgi:hypothetical protein
MSIEVTADNFVRAETDRMFAGLLATSEGLNTWKHHRDLAPLDQQTVIRMNRDTLYSFAVVDISGGATVTVPDSNGRYLSVMVVNQDHYINAIFHEPGTYDLTVDKFDTRYVALAARVLVNADDPIDLAKVAAIQDGFGLAASSAEPFAMPDYEEASFTATRQSVLDRARTMTSSRGMFGTKEETDRGAHLIGTAAGWGGLPEREAFYAIKDPKLPVGAYQVVLADVPVDAFWSVTVYNREGFLEPNSVGRYSVNSVSATRNEDDSVTVRLGGDETQPNCLPLMEGWNYAARLYRPRPEVLDGTWVFPGFTEVG